MMRRWNATAVAGLAMVLAGVTPSLAQQVSGGAPPPSPAVQQALDQLAEMRAEFDLIRRQYDERLLALEERLHQLGAGPLVVADPASPAQAPAAPTGQAPTQEPAPAPAEPPAGASQAGAPMPAGGGRVFNPDTSVIGNFLGVAGKNPFADQPSMQLTEAEVAFQAVVDPYAKADFFLSAGPQGLDIEEGFATFTSLPGNLLVKVGKMRASFGKVNTLHTHAMPTADRPLVTGNLVGGEEGLSDSGVSVSHLINNPALFLEATGEVFASSSDVFQGASRSRLTYVGRLRGYHDLTEDKNLDVGVSYALGPTDQLGEDGVNRNKTLVGLDATFRYRPLRRAIYSRINLRSEFIWSRQDLPSSERTSAFGFYGLGEWQFAQRWYLGARVDRSGRALDGTAIDQGGSVFVTFWPTEFSQIRSQFRRTTYAEGESANEALFQLNFSIGAHGAHAF